MAQITLNSTGVASNGSLVLQSNGTTAAVTVDASQNVGVGVTPAAKLDVLGDIFARASALRFKDSGNTTQYAVLYGDATTFNINAGVNNLILFSAGTERARIDSSGNLLVGATSGYASGATPHLFVSANTSGKYVGVFKNANATPGCLALDLSADPNNASDTFIATIQQRFAVRSNGGIVNYSANNVNLSDRREKTNFAPAKSYLDVICAIPVQTFNYIDQNMEDDGGLTLGVVAQDVQAVAPELVMESNWASKDAEPKMRLSIYQTDLQYALMKCIQEQQALITTLTARITALESA
jgi:hypothetical protein